MKKGKRINKSILYFIIRSGIKYKFKNTVFLRILRYRTTTNVCVKSNKEKNIIK